jgi:hypothetical protein
MTYTPDNDAWVDDEIAQEQARRSALSAPATQGQAPDQSPRVAGVNRPETMDYLRAAAEASSRLARGVGTGLRAIGLETPGKYVEDLANKDIQEAQQSYSPGWREMKEAPTSASNIGQKLVSGAVEMLPSMAVMGPAAKAVGAGATALGAGEKVAALAGAGVGGAAGFGLPAAGDLAKQIQDADPSTLSAAPRFQEIYNSLGDIPEDQRFEAARQKMTNEAVAGRLGWEAGLNAAMGPLGSKVGEVLGGASKSGLVNFGRNVAQKGVEGAGFGAGSAVASNLAANEYLGEDHPLTQGTGQAALETGLMGGIIGAGEGGRRPMSRAQTDAAEQQRRANARTAYNAETERIVATPTETDQTLQAAGVADKPEWQQALAAYDAIAGNQDAVSRALPTEEGASPTPVEQGANAQQALGPALERAWYDPSQVEERYQRSLQQGATVTPEEIQSQNSNASPFPKTLEESSALAQQAQEQARQAIIDAQSEQQRQEAIQQFEQATQQLMQLQALPYGGQDFNLVPYAQRQDVRAAQTEQQAVVDALNRRPALPSGTQDFELVPNSQRRDLPVLSTTIPMGTDNAGLVSPRATAINQAIESAQAAQDAFSAAKTEADKIQARQDYQAAIDALNQAKALPAGSQDFEMVPYDQRRDVQLGMDELASRAEVLGKMPALPYGGQDFNVVPEPPAPKPRQLSPKEQKQASALAKRIDNLTKLLSVEKNPAARARVEETRTGYEVELRNLTGETAPALNPEEQARADALRQERETPPAALPQGQGFDLVGKPQDYTQAEAASMGPLVRESGAQVETPTVKYLSDFDAGKALTEEQAVRQYQEQQQRDAAQEYGAKTLSPLWAFLRGRVDAKSISDHFGSAVLEDLRGKAPRDIFKSRGNGGIGWDKLEQEAKSQGLLPQDGDMLQSLLSNVTNKEQAQRDRINGANEVWNRDEGPVGSDSPAPEESGMVPINSDGTTRDGAGPMYRQGKPSRVGLSPNDLKVELDKTPYAGVTVLNSPADLPDARLRDEMLRSGNDGARGAYDPRTGQAYVFASNHTDLTDAVQTARDELFHQGTFRWAEQQAQANPKAGPAFKQLNSFMSEVRAVKRDTINKWLDANDYGELKNSNYGAAEWLTHEASKQAPKWHDRYVVAVVEFFRKLGNAIGFDFGMTEAEIRNWSRKVEEGIGGADTGSTDLPNGDRPVAYRRAHQQPVLTRPEDGIADAPDRKERFTKEAIKGTLDSLYQKAVDQAYPALREAAKVSPQAKETLQNAISYQRGAGGVTEQLLTGDGGIYDYAKPNSTAPKANTESLKTSVAPVAGDQKLSEALDLVLKGERSVALAKFRPEIQKADYLADRKYWTDALREAQTPEERRLINGQLEAIKMQYERGVKGIDAQYWSKRLGEIKQSLSPDEYAKVQEAADGYRRYMRNAILDPLHEAGILSDASYKSIINAPENEWYAPFQREMNNVERQYVGSADVVKELRGSDKNTLPAVESAIAYTQRAVKLVAQNNVSKAFIAARDASPDLQKIITQAKVDPGRVNQANYIRVVENGVKKYYEAPKEYLQAINGMNQQEAGLFQKVMALPAKTLRFGATMSLEFPLRNWMRDQWTAMINSDYNYKPFIDSLRGLAKIVMKDPIVKEWQAAGGDSGYLTSLDRSVKHVEAKEILDLQQRGLIHYASNPVDALRAIRDGLRSISDYSEKATRVGLYANARAKGATPSQAITESRMGTIDFSRMGTQGKALNQIVAFWNANVQDADIMTRRILNKPGQTLSKIALGITLPSVLLWASQHEDDRWKQIPTWLKTTCWVVLPWWDKTASPICIPKPFLMGALFGSSVEHMLDYASGANKNGLSDAITGVCESSFPGILPTALTPWIENKTNFSFFRGQPLENSSMQNLPSGMRANTQTQDIFRSLGKMTNISPIKMENLWRGYTGNLGLAGSALVSKGMDAAMGNENPPEVAQRLTEAPGLRAIFGREPIGSASKSVDDFYKNYQDAEQASFAYRSLLKSGDKQAADRFYSENKDKILMASNMGDVAKKMSKIRQDMAAIRQSMSLSPDEKRDQIDSLSRKETQLTDSANTSFDTEEGHPFQKLRIDYQVMHEQQRELEKAGKYSEATKLKMENSLYRKGNLVNMVTHLKTQRKKVEDNPRIAESDREKILATLDKRIKDAMDRAVALSNK